MTLDELAAGQSGEVVALAGEGGLRQHILDMGVIPGSGITVVKFAPLGDPMEISIHGYELTLRLDEARLVEIVQKDDAEAWDAMGEIELPPLEHPGYGEGGRHHDRKQANPLPRDTVLSFALAGNQNCGKTTLFNQITGSSQHVGNFPGVTVDRKDGTIIRHPNTIVVDLPGIYSLSPYSTEEIVSRDFILKENPHAIINIVDATNIERNLYLTMQLMELNKPMVVALNMMDEVTGNGGAIDVNRLEERLGVPVVPISAINGEGVTELINHAIHIAHFQEGPLRQDFCLKSGEGGAVHRCLHAVAHLIEDHAERAGIPVRFAASKLIEGDPLIEKELSLSENEHETLEHIVDQLESERGLDRAAAIADMRYKFIYGVCQGIVRKPHTTKERERSERIDEVLTGKWTAIPVFIALMLAIFYITFSWLGPWLQDLMAAGIESLAGIVDTALTSADVNETIHSLIIKGVFEGVGSVLSFLPIIICLFFFLSLLEDSGYLARVAFFMDKPMRRIGLSGRSIVPLLIGFGCSVPAVMATRTLPSERDRKMTILLTPFMSCTAKMPIYGFFVAAFFPDHAFLIVSGLYLLGILMGVLMALVYSKSFFPGNVVPFVMELPNYRMPSPKNVVQLLWEKAKDFLTRAFSVILVATIIVWFLSNFNLQLDMVTSDQDSMMARVAGLMAPLFAPIGLGDWRICTSLISGFMAKESVVSIMEMLYKGGVATALTSAAATSMLVFSLLYTPCVAAIASVKRELGGLYALSVVVWQCVVAWVVAFVVFHICIALGMG